MKSTPSPGKHRILYLNPTSAIGGAEISLLELLRNLNREVFEPLVALPGLGPLVERVARLEVETVIIPQHKLKAKNPIPYLKTVFYLINLVRRRHVNLIHSNVEMGNQYGVMAARLSGVPIICHTRGLLSERPFRRMFLRYTDVLIANSRAVAASYANCVAKSQKVVVIHNGVDLDEFSPIRARSGVFRRKLGLPDNAFVIGHIARICPEKGQHTLIDAMTQITENHSEVYALIVGDTVIDDSAVFLTSLRQRVLQYELAEKVIFVSFVDNMIDLYADLDLVVLPSLCEPFGRTLIEAMAMGKPVVATRAGGAVEVVEHGVTGLLVPPKNHIQLAEAILKVTEDRDAAREFGMNGRTRVERLFSIEQNARKTEQVYLETLRS
jgi:glycosyltransferase involved in cell wall biosynthesis